MIARPCSDRGYVYWRLLSTNPEAAKAVVLAERPTITDDSSQVGR
jgi:AP-1 complex subunit beta-1